ncbi:FumA C-terminus/TtdB family hydratase beta subunit [Acetonema longum]|uniref:Hydro-lyase, Fe-S type, tartrate/fumarate subfamily, beta subunit n=1 Tax=Acetonema longum DSM 6540 TaxID=1009370 RepID=F7NJ70_9FIRM|nr:FumA C-terminus/TtdB family hydratase beta subunit [Acetonema longum]EGO63917.1 hydro-lyase, Fe-S type, tartrate/fumarate subfamily, beta subunit [Acetonema longum DSM 6540]
MTEHNLTLPVNDAQVENLSMGDTVYLTGTVYTARDMAHLEIKRLREKGEPLPVELSGRAIFHAGPVVRKTDKGWELVVIGPTTSIRMEPHAGMTGELGVKLIIGKGGLAKDSREMFQKHKQAYLQAAPGCAVQLAAGVKKVTTAYWPENGMPEAMWVLEVERFGPFIVTMDTWGNSRYDEVKDKAYQRIKQIYG